MSKRNKNPYREGTNYHSLFGFIQSNQVVTRAALIEQATGLTDRKGNPLSETAAAATATVLLSPREVDGRGDCRGNASAQGHVYFMQPLNKVKGEPRKFRLRWRKTPLDRLSRKGTDEIQAEASQKSDVPETVDA